MEKSFREWVLNPRRIQALGVRDQVETGIREFFKERGFIETRTPLLVSSPGMETHIRPLEVKGNGSSQVFLPTSPEFAMKKLLAGGLEKIFQISPVFRSEPVSRTHYPEFTMLEWYRSEAGEEEIRKDVEELFVFLSETIFGKSAIRFQGREIDLAAPWPCFKVNELFKSNLDIDLQKADTVPALVAHCQRLGVLTSEKDSWDDLFFKIWLDHIEPRLPADRPCFITRYPASQAALAVTVEERGERWAKRFEVFLGGLELANAFEELTDPVEQRRRFEADMDLRQKTYGDSFPPNPIDEDFLRALKEGMPRCGGIALGVDRLVMLMADENDIAFTHWLPPHWPSDYS